MKRMLFFVVAALLYVPALAAEAKPGPCPEWKHTKKYPIEVLKVLSPTEFQIKLLEDGKTYRFRLAHVEPIKQDNKKDSSYQNYISSYKQTMIEKNRSDAPFIYELWVEFENDSVTSEQKSSSTLIGYLFKTRRSKGSTTYIENGKFPINTNYVCWELDKQTPSKYTTEFYGDSANKSVFDWFSMPKAKLGNL